jgi:putative transposase
LVKYRRNLIPGATFFFTVALADRRSCALTAHVDILRHAFRTARGEMTFDIDAIVILPDHLHTVMTLPEGDADFPQRWRRIKSAFTRGLVDAGAVLPSRDRTGRVLWQRRYWEHTIRDEDDFARHVDYVHYNPTKHGLAGVPAAWPYSSLQRLIRAGVLPSDWGQGDGLAGGFGEPGEP